MLENHSPFVEVMKFSFLAHPKIFFTYFFVFPAAPIAVNTLPFLLLLFLCFFSSITHFSLLSSFLLMFVLSNFQFWFVSFLSARIFFPHHSFFTISVPFFCFYNICCLIFVNSPLHITLSVCNSTSSWLLKLLLSCSLLYCALVWALSTVFMAQACG